MFLNVGFLSFCLGNYEDMQWPEFTQNNLQAPKTTWNHLQPPTTTYNHQQPPLEYYFYHLSGIFVTIFFDKCKYTREVLFPRLFIRDSFFRDFLFTLF